MRATARIDLVLLAGMVAVSTTACVDQPPAPPSRGAAPSPTPAPSTAAPSFLRPTPNPSPTFLVHQVMAGETLTSIARLYGTTARSIAYWNREAYPSLDPDSPEYDPDRIVVGWLLELIPTEVVDEDELPEPTVGPSPSPSSQSPSSPSPTPS